MQGLMQDWPLTVDKIADHARDVHGHTEVVTRALDGAVHRTTYAAINERARRLTTALLKLDIRLGDRVGTLAWNSADHLAAWYGVMGMGAVCHTFNPRLLPTQLGWMADHAGDKAILADVCFASLLGPMLAGAPGVKHLVWLCGEAERPDFAAPAHVNVHCLETLLADAAPTAGWGGFDEGTAAGLCYTSGTTGDPKGVLYSHRSNVLHAMMTMQADVIGATARDTVLAVVPMFHASAWGLPFSAPAAGAKLVLPGARLDGASIHELIETEQVTFSAAVPTVWANLLGYLRETGKRIDSLKAVIIGGAAVNQAMMQAYQDEYGVEVIHAWGMTETSPLGSVSRLTVRTAGLDEAGQMAMRMKQGRAPFGVELKVVGEDGAEQPHDGHAFGALKVRGAAVASAYFRSDQNILDGEGFFDTGDIATLDGEGFMQITDRAKDVIKSGGEWISSIDIENHVLAHPAAELAAVIGVAHPKWNERPVLLVKRRAGHEATPTHFREWLDGKIAKWWMPDDVLLVDAIPLGATGKVDKKALRATLADYVLPDQRPAPAPPPVLTEANPAPVIHAPEAPAPAPEPPPPAVAAPETTVVEPLMATPFAAEPPQTAPEPLPVVGPFPTGSVAPAIREEPAPPRALTLDRPEPTPVPPAPPKPVPAAAAPSKSVEAAAVLWGARLAKGLRIVTALGLGAAVLTALAGLVAPNYLDEVYKFEVAVLAFALIGFVAALALEWKTYGRAAIIAVLVAMLGLGCNLILSAAWQPRGAFPAIQTQP